MDTGARQLCLLKIVFAASALLLFAAAGWTADQVVDTIERSFAVSGRAHLSVNNVDGRTHIAAGTGSHVLVKAVKEVRGNVNSQEAQRLAARVEVRIDQSGNGITAEVKYPHEFFSIGDRPHVLVNFEITAPEASDISAKSVDGRLEVEGFNGRLELSTVDGDLNVHHCSGQISAKCVDGKLTLDGVDGQVEAQTVDGDQIIEGNLQSLDAHSTDGGVEIRALPGSKMTRDWSIHATDGSVRLRLPQGFAADLDLSSGDGKVSSDYPLSMTGELKENRLSGKLNGGGSRLRIHTSDGDIRLLR